MWYCNTGFCTIKKRSTRRLKCIVLPLFTYSTFVSLTSQWFPVETFHCAVILILQNQDVGCGFKVHPFRECNHKSRTRQCFSRQLVPGVLFHLYKDLSRHSTPGGRDGIYWPISLPPPPQLCLCYSTSGQILFPALVFGECVFWMLIHNPLKSIETVGYLLTFELWCLFQLSTCLYSELRV